MVKHPIFVGITKCIAMAMLVEKYRKIWVIKSPLLNLFTGITQILWFQF